MGGAAVTVSGRARAWTYRHQAEVVAQRRRVRADEEARVLADAPRAGDADLQDGAGRQEALEGLQPRGALATRSSAPGSPSPRSAPRSCAELGALTDSSVTRTPPRLK
jgi:hypothetical protein